MRTSSEVFFDSVGHPPDDGQGERVETLRLVESQSRDPPRCAFPLQENLLQRPVAANQYVKPSF